MDFLSLRSTGKAISGKVYKGSNKKSDFDISPFSNNFPLNNEDKKEFNIFGSFNQIYPIINHEPPGPKKIKERILQVQDLMMSNQHKKKPFLQFLCHLKQLLL